LGGRCLTLQGWPAPLRAAAATGVMTPPAAGTNVLAGYLSAVATHISGPAVTRPGGAEDDTPRPEQTGDPAAEPGEQPTPSASCSRKRVPDQLENGHGEAACGPTVEEENLGAESGTRPAHSGEGPEVQLKVAQGEARPEHASPNPGGAPPGEELVDTSACSTAEGSSAGETNQTVASWQQDGEQEALGPDQQAVSDPRSAEGVLTQMLSAMDLHVQELRAVQQWLVGNVEYICRHALGPDFGKLKLVGSVALCVEMPGSDLDVVCFTRSTEGQASSCPADYLQRLHEAFVNHPGAAANFALELIIDARVPILRVRWAGMGGRCIAVDISVNQTRPVEHVTWFQRVGAAPCPSPTPPAAASQVTVTLRCIKWWLRQRQIPQTKEGGLPTLAWLLMAVHVCALPDTRARATNYEARPMTALLTMLGGFFHYFAVLGGLDGSLKFKSESSEFQRRTGERQSPWSELSILDPTSSQALDLAPHLPPATQLLLMYELRRASHRLPRDPRVVSEAAEDDTGGNQIREVFEPVREGCNSLPSILAENFAVLALVGNPCTGVGNIEVALVYNIIPRAGWAAPFLMRSDNQSEVYVHLLDLHRNTGRCYLRDKGFVLLCPCHFICRVQLSQCQDGRTSVLCGDGLERFNGMKQYLHEMRMYMKGRRNRKKDVQRMPTAVAAAHADRRR